MFALSKACFETVFDGLWTDSKGKVRETVRTCCKPH